MGSIIFKVIKVALRAITPELDNVLQGMLATLTKQAEATASPWDDVLVEILATLLNRKEDIE